MPVSDLHLHGLFVRFDNLVTHADKQLETHIRLGDFRDNGVYVLTLAGEEVLDGVVGGLLLAIDIADEFLDHLAEFRVWSITGRFNSRCWFEHAAWQSARCQD